MLYHETLREAIARNVDKDLGDIALPLLPVGLQPFTVAEFFPTPGLSEYYDPRQHAIALCYVVPIAGDCKPQDETLDVEWVDPKSDVMNTFVAQMVNGHGRIVRQALAWATNVSITSLLGSTHSTSSVSSCGLQSPAICTT